MTDKEILTMAGQYGHWINGEVLEMNDVGVIEFVNAVVKEKAIKDWYYITPTQFEVLAKEFGYVKAKGQI